MDKNLNETEKVYFDDAEVKIANQEEVVVKKPDNHVAIAFKKKHGYSLTFSKLMERFGCKTPDEYRTIRRQNKKSNKNKNKSK